MLSGNALSNGHALFFCLVCQHRAPHHIAHRPHIGQVGFAVAIDHDGTALIQLQAHGFRVQARGVGHATDGDDQLVHIQALGFALGVGIGHRHAFFAVLDVAHFHAEFDLQTLLVKGLLGLFGNLLVDRAQESRQAFQDGDFRAQTAPDRTHLQANHARANQRQLLGHIAQAQGTVIGQHIHFIKGHARQSACARTRGHNDVLARQ